MNPKYIVLIISFLLIMGLLVIPNQDSNNVVYLAAPSSMSSAITEVDALYNQNTKLNFAGSGTLVNQIQQGAPADVFISASADSFNNLKSTNTVLDESTLVYNNLVLIKNKSADINTLNDINTLAIGTPNIVPAGKYAVEALNYYNLYDSFTDKIIQTKDVSEVLTYVETGNVDAGIVYLTDAMLSDKVQVVYQFPQESHSPIEYKIGLLTEKGRDLYNFLISEQATKIYNTYGFDTNG